MIVIGWRRPLLAVMGTRHDFVPRQRQGEKKHQQRFTPFNSWATAFDERDRERKEKIKLGNNRDQSVIPFFLFLQS